MKTYVRSLNALTNRIYRAYNEDNWAHFHAFRTCVNGVWKYGVRDHRCEEFEKELGFWALRDKLLERYHLTYEGYWGEDADKELKAKLKQAIREELEAALG